MAKAFKRTRRGIAGHLEPGERQLLGRLFQDIIALLEPEEPGNADPLAALVGVDTEATVPADSALLRLLPSAVQDDDVEALEFRRLTERSLREGKIGALRAGALFLEQREPVLSTEQAQLLAKALNDVRLVLADRLAIETEEDADRLRDTDDWSKADDVDTYLALVYNFVTWLQETLMQALLDTLAAGGGNSPSTI